MTRVLIGIAVALIVLVGAALAAPSFVDWNRYRDEIAARVEAAVGRDVVIGGDIDFTLLPSPAFSVRDVQIANSAGAAAASLVSLGSLDIRVAFGPLLRGSVEVRTVVLQEPAFELEILADGTPNWSMRAGSTRAGVGVGTGMPGGVQVDNLQIHNGTVTFRDARRGIVERLHGVDADISARAQAGPYLAEGAFTYRGLPVRFGFNSATVTPGRPIGLRADFTLVPDGDKLEFRGALSEMTADGALSGTLTFEGKNFATLVERVARAFEAAPPALAAIPAAVRISAQTSLKPAEFAFNDIDARIGDLAAKGAVNFALTATPRLDATMAMSQLDLDALLARVRPAAPARPATFRVPSLQGTFSLTVEATTYRQRLVRNLDLAASLNDGVLSVSRAKAQLPGVTEVDAKGQLVAANGLPQFDGETTLRSDNLRDLLGWLRIDVAAVPADRLRTLAFQGRVRLRPDVVQAYAFDARLDATIAKGAAAYAFRARPAFSLDLDVDRFDADAYLRTVLRDRRWSWATLDTFDTDVRLRIGELTAREQPVRGIVVDAGLIAGVLTMRELSVVDAAGARGTVAGIAQGFSDRPVATGTVNIAAESAAGLARMFDLAFIAAPERLGAFAFNASLDGDRDKLTVDAGALVAGTDIRLQGNVRSLGQDPIVDLAVEAQNPSLAALLQTLGVGAGAAAAAPPAPLHLGATFSGGLGNLSVLASGFVAEAEVRAAGTLAVADALAYRFEAAASHPDVSAYFARLGLRYRPAGALGAASVRAAIEGTRHTLAVALQQAAVGEARLSGTFSADRSGPRPRYAANLKADILPLDRFLPAGPAGAPRRDWSSRPLPLGFLRASDFELELAVADLTWRGARFADALVVARAADARVVVSPAHARVFGGEMDLSATVTATDMAAVEVDLSVRNIDLADAPKLPWAVVPAAGRLTATIDVAAIGATEYELMSTLRGSGTFQAADGVLRGLDFSRSGQDLDRLKDAAELPDLLTRLTSQGETAFRAIDAVVRGTDGVIALDSLTARLEGAAIAGGGTIDLPRRRTALELSVALTAHAEAPPFALELSGPWDAPRRLARSRELQGYVSRRLTAAPPVPAVAPAAPPAAAQEPAPPPAEVPFEERMRGLLDGLRPTP